MSKLIAKESLEEIILNEGMTQKELAEHIDMTAAQVCRIVNRNAKPRPKTAKKIADALGRRVIDLFEKVG